MKVCNLDRSLSVINQVSLPYNITDFTFELKIFSLVLLRITGDRHTGLSVMKANCAFLTLASICVFQGGHMTGKCWDAGISTFLAKMLGNAGIRTFEEKLAGKCWDLGFSPKKLTNKLTTFYKICTFFRQL